MRASKSRWQQSRAPVCEQDRLDCIKKLHSSTFSKHLVSQTSLHRRCQLPMNELLVCKRRSLPSSLGLFCCSAARFMCGQRTRPTVSLHLPSLDSTAGYPAAFTYLTHCTCTHLSARQKLTGLHGLTLLTGRLCALTPRSICISALERCWFSSSLKGQFLKGLRPPRKRKGEDETESAGKLREACLS
jgi:hypothetical protein